MGWTGKGSVRSVITSSQRGGELQESEAPGEKRIMGREWGTASRPHAEREDAWPRQREKCSHNITHTDTHTQLCIALLVVLRTNAHFTLWSTPRSLPKIFYQERKSTPSALTRRQIHQLSVVPLRRSYPYPFIFSLFSSSGLCLTATHSTWLPVTMANDKHKEHDLHDSVWSVRSVRLTHKCSSGTTVGALWPLVTERFNKVWKKKKKAKVEKKEEKNSN